MRRIETKIAKINFQLLQDFKKALDALETNLGPKVKPWYLYTEEEALACQSGPPRGIVEWRQRVGEVVKWADSQGVSK